MQLFSKLFRHINTKRKVNKLFMLVILFILSVLFLWWIRYLIFTLLLKRKEEKIKCSYWRVRQFQVPFSRVIEWFIQKPPDRSKIEKSTSHLKIVHNGLLLFILSTSMTYRHALSVVMLFGCIILAPTPPSLLLAKVSPLIRALLVSSISKNGLHKRILI